MSSSFRTFIIPLLAVQGYLTFVLLLYLFGPWPWPSDNDLKLVLYLIAAQALIAIGYLSAWPRSKSYALATDARIRRASVGRGLKFFEVAFWISLLMIVPTSFARSGSAIPDVMSGISYTGEVYNANIDRLSEGGVEVYVEYLRYLLGPWLLGFLPLLVFYWSKIHAWKRAVSVIIVLYFIAIYISIGVNKGIADVIITVPFLVYMGNKARTSNIRIPKRVLQIVGIGVFVAFLILFGRGQEGREGDVGREGVFNSGLELVWADSGTFGDIAGPDARIAYESLARYLTGGYYVLALAFDTEHKSTYGIGNSMFLARQADAVFGTTYFTEESLPGRIEANLGISQFGLWHSAYTWIASDVGFAGALVVVALFARSMALTWSLAVFTLDFRSVILFYFFVIMFFYLPGNNQIFQSGESCLAFLFFAGWLFLANPFRQSAGAMGRGPALKIKPAGFGSGDSNREPPR
jgi:hypothetical protein